jgi:prepilin-type N-terminal cleavage/methylation domain-containing protein
MKPGEKGYTLIELMIAITIMVVASGVAGAAIFQILRNTERNNDRITAVRQVQNAGYWISRDAQMAETVATDNLTLPDFLTLSWTEWDAAGDPISHSATYFFEDLTDGVGKFKRSHLSSAGASEQTLIAQYIYYDPNDVDATSKASYQSPVLTVQLTALFEQTRESREYMIKHRVQTFDQ